MSNNTINYTVYKDGKQVGHHSQNVMCKRCNDKLLEFQPAKDFTIVCEGYYDDYEEDYDDDYEYEYEDEEPQEHNLEEWLRRNPAELTHRKFSVGDTVKLNKRRGLATVKEFIEGQWFPQYLVDINGEETTIGQTEIIPMNLQDLRNEKIKKLGI